MSIQSLITDNKFIIHGQLASLTGASKSSMLVSDGSEYKPVASSKKFEILNVSDVFPTQISWVNRRYCCNITSKNNNSVSPNAGINIPAKINTGPMSIQNNIGGGYTLVGSNDISTNTLFSNTTDTPAHKVFISFNVRKAPAFGAPPVIMEFYLFDNVTGIIPETVTTIVVTDMEQIVTINSIIDIPPNLILSLYYTNTTSNAEILVKHVDWYMEFMGTI